MGCEIWSFRIGSQVDGQANPHRIRRKHDARRGRARNHPGFVDDDSIGSGDLDFVPSVEVQHPGVAGSHETAIPKAQTKARGVAVIEVGREERHVVDRLAIVLAVKHQACTEQRAPHASVAFHVGLKSAVLEKRHAEEVMCVCQLVAHVQRPVSVGPVVVHGDGGVKATNGLESHVESAVKKTLPVVLHVRQSKPVAGVVKHGLDVVARHVGNQVETHVTPFFFEQQVFFLRFLLGLRCRGRGRLS